MQKRLIEMATTARSFLEPVWIEWHTARGGKLPAVPSQSTCGRSSLFVVKALRHVGITATWKTGVPRHFEGGPELGPIGFHANGRWQSHAWVEACGYIIDITADQFGAAPVIVVPTGDRRYAEGTEDTALPAFVANRTNAVEAIWPRWLTYCGHT
ncbi:hypothetical protein HK16_11550 [Acetobacter senegalensis]|uniref:Uncharacterized protein n=2 Tax=Acetobacter TaxID=434 RepID=A0A252EJ61_9PROT|nr:MULTISPECIES: hypothetical protein [Acetobacter]OUL66244.1 hypothetical protein HK16_11550 [Acetobacter senegalensis]